MKALHTGTRFVCCTKIKNEKLEQDGKNTYMTMKKKQRIWNSIGHQEGGINTFCCFSFNANWFLSLSTKCFMVLLGARWEASFANSSSSLSTSIYA